MDDQRTPFDARSTADDVLAGHDLTGRTAVVTGGASGIGVETARSLARAGAEVTIAVRDTAAGDRAAAGIDRGTVRVARLDLADLATVRDFADGWTGPLDLLINNAGVMAVPERTLSADGHELQFAVNHLGHFALALGLHDALAAAEDARVVAVSSSGHLAAPVDLADVDFGHRDYDPWVAYGQSKTANVLFAVEAWRRWRADGITTNAVMPGGIMTNLQRHVPEQVRAEWAGIPTNKTPEQGAATTMVAAVAPQFHGDGGHYLEDAQVARVVADDDRDATAGVRAWALDPDTARRLWELSCEQLDTGGRTR